MQGFEGASCSALVVSLQTQTSQCRRARLQCCQQERDHACAPARHPSPVLCLTDHASWRYAPRKSPQGRVWQTLCWKEAPGTALGPIASLAHRKLWRQVPGISAPSHQTPTRLLPPSSQEVSPRRTFAWLISDAQERHALPQRRPRCSLFSTNTLSSGL